jgi:starch synthase (maltosyl-transferring)
MRNRTIITNIWPALENGKHYIKRVPGEQVRVQADIFCDGEDSIRAVIRHRSSARTEDSWEEVPMYIDADGRWEGRFTVTEEGFHDYHIMAWIDHLRSWHRSFRQKHKLGLHVAADITLGLQWLRSCQAAAESPEQEDLETWIRLLENSSGYQASVELILSPVFESLLDHCELRLHPTVSEPGFRVRVGRQKEQFSTWYLLFPRSTSDQAGQHGTLRDCMQRLPRIASMGFDTLLLTPIFPIGQTNRKGRNNSLEAKDSDPGSPWSVGCSDGGHKDIHPALGTLADFEELVRAARTMGMELALDMGLRCSLDHPYLKEHPDWFVRLPDGSFHVEEVPPLNYMDIVEFDFECDDWEGLWEELLSVFLFWAEKGVRIFYASTPQRKPFSFWDWLIRNVQDRHPDVIFVSGALTHPLVMRQLAKSGFNQAISNFLWKTSANEIRAYMQEISNNGTQEFMCPNFFTNTPDILPHFLADAGPATFLLRYALAATLCSNCGVYGPVFELMHNQRYPGSKERYLHSEKYEVVRHDWEERNKLMEFIGLVNQIRKENSAFHNAYNLAFTQSDNDKLLGFVRVSTDRTNLIWCIVNLDDRHPQSGYVEVPKALLNLKGSWFNLKVTDLLTREEYHWFNDWNFVELNPFRYPMHILQVELG